MSATVVGGAMALTLTSASVNSPSQAQEVTWTVPVSGVATGTGYLHAVHVQAGWGVTCSTVVAKAQAHRGLHITGNAVVSITDMSFDQDGATCDGPMGTTMTITVESLPLSFNARAYDPNSSVVTGRVSGINVTVESSDGCVLTLAGPAGQRGEVDASYTNADGKILIEDQGHLRIATVNNDCGGAGLEVGDTITVNGELELTPRGIITSP